MRQITFYSRPIAFFLLVSTFQSCQSVKTIYNALQISKVFKLTGNYSNNNTFDDGVINVQFNVQKNQLDFSLTNLTSKPVKINWDECSLIFNGKSKRIIHSGIRFVDRNNAQALTTIPIKAKIDDYVLPSDNIVMEYHSFDATNMGQLAQNWKTKNMISLSDVGFSFYLSLKVNDKNMDYTFVFENTNKKSKEK